MQITTLAELVREKGQSHVGRLLGMTQASVRGALLSGREVYVTRHPDGSYSAEERRPFPATAKKAS